MATAAMGASVIPWLAVYCLWLGQDSEDGFWPGGRNWVRTS